MSALDTLESIAEKLDRFLPRGLANGIIDTIANQRRRGPIVGLQDSQRFPAFGACHPQIDRIIGSRRKVDRLAVLDVYFETAARGTVAAYHIRRRIRNHYDR